MVAIKISEHNLVKNLRFAFTDPKVLIAELMQNSRRAGATYVCINFNEEQQALTFIDDGCGIADFEPMFTIAETGWNESVQDDERPFGMGFISTLFYADEIEIISLNQHIRFRTKDALALANIDMLSSGTSPFMQGTQITLFGINLDYSVIENAVARYAKGFPISVRFNNSEMERPHAIDCMPFEQTAIGLVHLNLSWEMLCYLQGIPVGNNHRLHCVGKPTVVHLSNQFRGNMPDRSRLFDEDNSVSYITQTIHQLREQHLLSLQNELSVVDFANKYWNIATNLNLLDLFEMPPFIPSRILGSIYSTPCTSTSYDGKSYIGTTAFGVTAFGVHKHQVESGEVVLFSNPPTSDDDEYWHAAILAKALGWVFIDVKALPKAHWAKKYIIDLGELNVSLSYVALSSTYFSGAQVNAELVLCESYTLSYDKHHILINDEAVYWQGKIIVPQYSRGVEALCQVEDYYFDDNFDGTLLAEDEKLLQRLIRSERIRLSSGSQVDILKEILADSVKLFPALAKSSFLIKFDDSLNSEITQM